MKNTTFLLGIRGYYENSMGKPGNDRGIYDDAMILVTPTLFSTYNCNTDPSVWRTGIATLKPGVWWYTKGEHGVRFPKNSPRRYPALRQARPVTVTRDGGKEESDGPGKMFFINIHRGGYTSTSSEGCQTIWPDQWREFIKDAFTALENSGSAQIPYVLITEDERRKWMA